MKKLVKKKVPSINKLALLFLIYWSIYVNWCVNFQVSNSGSNNNNIKNYHYNHSETRLFEQRHSLLSVGCQNYFEKAVHWRSFYYFSAFCLTPLS